MKSSQFTILTVMSAMAEAAAKAATEAASETAAAAAEATEAAAEATEAAAEADAEAPKAAAIAAEASEASVATETTDAMSMSDSCHGDGSRVVPWVVVAAGGGHGDQTEQKKQNLHFGSESENRQTMQQ